MAAVKTQTAATSAKDASVTTEPRAAAASKQLQAASTAATTLTAGKTVKKQLDPKRLGGKYKKETIFVSRIN